MNKPKQGGKRKGAGRKPAPLPSFTKRLRASDTERQDFMNMLTGDSTRDFIILYHLLQTWRGRDVTWVIRE